MLEYPLHGRLHSFLVLKRKCLLSGNSKQWHGWLQRDSEKGVAEVWCILFIALCIALYIHVTYIDVMQLEHRDYVYMYTPLLWLAKF